MNFQSGPLAQPPDSRTGIVLGATHPNRSSELGSGAGPVSHGSRRMAPSYPLVSTMPPLGALATAPGSARAHVRSTLAEWHMSMYEEVAELLSSELVTNAVEASTDGHGSPVYINGHMALVVFRMLA